MKIAICTRKFNDENHNILFADYKFKIPPGIKE